MSEIDLQIIQDLKSAILHSRYNAARLVNKELISLYFSIGQKISLNTKSAAWGSKILGHVSTELQKELPGLKGFSASNLQRMVLIYDFWCENLTIYPTASGKLEKDKKTNENSIYPTVSGKLQETTNEIVIDFSQHEELKEIFFSISFSHHYLIASKTKNKEEAIFYIKKTSGEYWSYRNLENQLKSNLFEQQGKLPNNFVKVLASSEKAISMFKDEYLLDFINIENPEEADEREIESEIVRNIKKFILTIGNDFAFMGNQFRVIVDEQEYFIDLLFYNRKLQCLVAFELKTGKFKPEYLGKMNFYLSVLDDKVKQENENPSIGIILCREKNNTVVEYSFRDFNKAMGVSTYKTYNEIPEQFREALPDSEMFRKILE